MVSTREAGGEAALVLIHASREIVGDARVYHSRPTGHDVHVVGAHDPPKSCIWGSRPASFLGGLALNPPSKLRLFLSLAPQARRIFPSAHSPQAPRFDLPSRPFRAPTRLAQQLP